MIYHLCIHRQGLIRDVHVTYRHPDGKGSGPWQLGHARAIEGVGSDPNVSQLN